MTKNEVGVGKFSVADNLYQDRFCGDLFFGLKSFIFFSCGRYALDPPLAFVLITGKDLDP